MSGYVWIMIILPTPEWESENLNETKTSYDLILKKSKGLTDLDKIDNKLQVPQIKKEEPNLKEILENCLKELAIDTACWCRSQSEHFYQVYFACDVRDSDSIIQFIHDNGIGLRSNTFVGIVPFSLHYESNENAEVLQESLIDTNENIKREDLCKKASGFKSLQEKFLKSVTARLTVAQVIASVQSGAELTFDFICYIIFAAWISAMGLIENSVVSLVASMLVSPLMGPVMAMTFGTIVKNKALRNMGIYNAVFGFGLAIFIGYVYGIIVLSCNYQTIEEWPTIEMRSRGELRILWVGALVAIPSGAAVAVSLLSGNQSSLVGVAISASLLPPCVNTGLLWAYSTIKAFDNPEEIFNSTITNSIYSENIVYECLSLGLVSLGLMLVNVFCIFIMAWFFLKVKEVTPLNSNSPETSRFWKEDVKIARDYNLSVTSNAQDLGKKFIEEWAIINGIDPNEVLGENPEAKLTQLMTLNDLLKDVENDEVLQRIIKQTKPENDVIRKMSMASGLINDYQPKTRRTSHIPNNSLDMERNMETRKSCTFLNQMTLLPPKPRNLNYQVRDNSVSSIDDVPLRNIRFNFDQRRKSAYPRFGHYSETNTHSLWPQTRRSFVSRSNESISRLH